jgi:hypothetical protein
MSEFEDDEEENYGNEKTVAKLQKLAKREQVRRDNALVNLMRTVDGRKFMWDVLGNCHIFSTCFHENPLIMAKAEGERNIGLMLFAHIMRVCPNEYLIMAKESQPQQED